MRVYQIEALGLVFLDHGDPDTVTVASDGTWDVTEHHSLIPRESFDDIRLGFERNGWEEVPQ